MFDIITSEGQTDLTEAEYAKLKDLLDDYVRIPVGRADYIKQKDLPIECGPAPLSWGGEGHWDTREDSQPVGQAYRRLAYGKSYNDLNHLRRFSWPFSGYHMASFDLEGAEKDMTNCSGHSISLYGSRFVETRKKTPDWLRPTLERRFGEAGFLIDGEVVNFDLHAITARLYTFYKVGVTKILSGDNPTWLEIGSGYGTTSKEVKTRFPNTNMFLLDLAESLVFPYIQLNITLPAYEHKLIDKCSAEDMVNPNIIKYVPAHMYDLVPHSIVDVAFNGTSFPEMAPIQRTHYSKFLSQALKGDGFLAEQNDHYSPELVEFLTLKADYITGTPPWNRIRIYHKQ